LAHRQQKTQTYSRAELQQSWREAAHAIGMRFDQTDLQATLQPSPEPGKASDLVALASLDWSIQHLAERESVMPLADVLQSAMRHAGGHTDIAAIQSALQTKVQFGSLIQEAPHYRSTQDM